MVERPQDESGASVLLIPCCSFVWDSSAFWQGRIHGFPFSHRSSRLHFVGFFPKFRSFWASGYPLGYFVLVDIPLLQEHGGFCVGMAV